MTTTPAIMAAMSAMPANANVKYVEPESLMSTLRTE